LGYREFYVFADFVIYSSFLVVSSGGETSSLPGERKRVMSGISRRAVLIYHSSVSSVSIQYERQVDQAEKSMLLKNLASCLPKNANESQVMGDHYVKVSPAPSMALVSLRVGQGRNYVVAWTLTRCLMSFYPRRSRGIRYPISSPPDGCTLRVGTPTYHRLIRSVSYSRLSGRGWARLWR
jgi:hypothetical protein